MSSSLFFMLLGVGQMGLSLLWNMSAVNASTVEMAQHARIVYVLFMIAGTISGGTSAILYELERRK